MPIPDAIDPAESGNNAAPRTGGLWEAVDRLLQRASLAGILAHNLAPLAAAGARARGEPVPESLQRHERTAAIANASAALLLRRIRESCDGPLVLLKGAEIAPLYPDAARGFGDVDLLSPAADDVHQSLLAAGFVAFGSEVPEDHHHLQPLTWPSLPLAIEVHSRINWPKELPQLRTAEIIEASVPAKIGIVGVSAPSPVHHSLALAVHGWQHHPLRVLRDLVDLAAVSASADERELEHGATALEIGRLWATTHRTVDALFHGGDRPLSLRTWARNVERVRERTRLEIDLEALISPFWWMPPGMAARHAATLAHRRLIARPDESPRERVAALATWVRSANKGRLGTAPMTLDDTRPAAGTRSAGDD